MKRRDLFRHRQAHGFQLDREGSKHSLWLNPATGEVESVPRLVEIGKHLSRKICRQLSVPEPRGA
jgi:hypothetical protein